MRPGAADAKASRGGSVRRGLFAVVILFFVVAAAVAVIGTIVVSSMRSSPARLTTPLRVYPVTQQSPGACPSNVRAIAGPGPAGETCYYVTDGLIIRQVTDVHVQRGENSGYEVSINLLPADGRTLEGFTRGLIGKEVAFVVRNRVVTAPRVDAPITQGKILITGTPTKSEADLLARQLTGARGVPAQSPAPPGPCPTSPTPSGPSSTGTPGATGTPSPDSTGTPSPTGPAASPSPTGTPSTPARSGTPFDSSPSPSASPCVTPIPGSSGTPVVPGTSPGTPSPALTPGLP